MEKLLAGTPRQADLARWKMGQKTGKRNEQARLLKRFEEQGLIWWSQDERVWLNMITGKPIYGLDWNEGQKYFDYNNNA